MTRVLGFLSLFLTAGLLLAPAGAGDEKKGKAEVEALFKKLDADMNGRLSKDEFLKMAERFKERDKARKELAVAFDKLDPEMRGINVAQFKTFMENRKRKDEK